MNAYMHGKAACTISIYAFWSATIKWHFNCHTMFLFLIATECNNNITIVTNIILLLYVVVHNTQV